MNRVCNCRAGLRLLFVLGVAARLGAQTWDLPAAAADEVAAGTGGRLKLGLEQRERYEIRDGNSFGNAVDIDTGLVRTRVSLTYQNSWLKVSGMMQDSRAPWYGSNAPATVRDPADLHEAYFELFSERKSGWSASAGRRMLNYGEGRLIGTPQWSNTSRTYDFARAAWNSKRARVEALLVSPIVFRPTEFNRPTLGNRVWGVYASFPDALRKALVEVYALRHDQNRPGGFTGGKTIDGTDRLGVNTLGFRLAGPFGGGWRYSVEGAAQDGKVGAARHRAGAWYSLAAYRWKTLEASAEYKYASGTGNPHDPSRVETFDQLFPANHDKFGHEDLLGWRNLHDARSLVTWEVRKGWTWNVMYNQFWLASPCDALYSGSGGVIARSASCAAGRHVGQEADVFTVYRYKHFQVGAGYGYFGAGEFVRATTHGVGPTYVYLFHTYSM
jgi:hypothetical protein